MELLSFVFLFIGGDEFLFFKLKMLYPFFILCLQREKNSANRSCSADFKLALGLFFLEEIMQLFWGTRLSPLPGRRCGTFQAVPVVKSVPSRRLLRHRADAKKPRTRPVLCAAEVEPML